MSGMFDPHWHSAIARRPVFPVDYWTGTPSITKEGRRDISSDVQHILSYADPIFFRSLYATTSTALLNKRPGWFSIPNVLGASDAQLAAWQAQMRRRLEPVLAPYRKEGVQLHIPLQLMMNSGGMDYTPAWYHAAVPDWEECDYSGTPLSQLPKGGRMENLACTMPCLFHPMLYKALDRVFKALSFLKEEPCFVGFHIDNELNLGDHRDLARVGGNKHTQTAFREFLKGVYPTVQRLNRAAGTAYRSFGEVEICDDNWLVQVMAARFRSTWIEGVYLSRCAALIKKHLPHAVTISRCQTAHALNEYGDGREVFDTDVTRFKESQLDVLAWNHLWQPGALMDSREFNAPIPAGFGAFNLTGSLLRGTGKMLGIPEFHAQRHVRYQWCPPRAEELLNYIYRGLHFNFRMLMLHSWDRENIAAASGVIYSEPFGAVYSKHPGTLRMIAQLRSELDRSRPFETFGKPILPPMGILLTRQARNFPGMGGWMYGNLLCQLSFALERPETGDYEVVEEQTCDLADALRQFKGMVVADACLTAHTRNLLSRFVGKGGKLLVMGAPAAVGPDYLPALLSGAYPIHAPDDTLSKSADRGMLRPIRCRIGRKHPVLEGLPILTVRGAVPVRPKAGSSILSRAVGGRAIVAANANVVYISGAVTDAKQLRRLLTNFRLWCGGKASDLFMSRFENATVVQNWDTSNHRPDGSVINKTPWTGRVPLAGSDSGAIREMREDHIWLAYHREGGQTVLESVKVAPQGVRVFRKEGAREPCHLEGLPDTLGFSFWWDGQMHPIIGRFSARRPTNVNARIVDGAEKARIKGWFVCEVGGKRIAEGRGRRVRFSVRPGKEYYFTAISRDSAHDAWKPSCALCAAHAFE